MNKELQNLPGKLTEEPIVIPDECGDSMWDAVLEQDVIKCDLKKTSNNPSSLDDNIDPKN